MEQRLLLPELPEHRAEVCLFLLNSGLRSESEAVRLDWRWEIAVPELGCSVFLVPGDTRKNEQDHVCVLELGCALDHRALSRQASYRGIHLPRPTASQRQQHRLGQRAQACGRQVPRAAG